MINTLPILRLPENSLGKDYVVGDLHGCIELLEELLCAVGFDQQRDRLFSVGDMIDRGPYSLRCLDLLLEPWFYAVKGNHEQMLLDFFWTYLQTGKIDRLEDVNATGFLDYGGAWVEHYFLADKRIMSSALTDAIKRVLKLPMMMIVGDDQSRFHVIHAELLRSGYRSTGQMVWLDSDIDSWVGQKSLRTDIEERMLWGRTMMSNLLNDKKLPRVHEGLSTTFCGHTYDDKPRQLLSHICIDTGAFASMGKVNANALTLFDVKESVRYAMSFSKPQLITESFPLF